MRGLAHQHPWRRFLLNRNHGSVLIHRARQATCSSYLISSLESATSRSISSTPMLLSRETCHPSLKVCHFSTSAGGAFSGSKEQASSSDKNKQKKDNPNLFLDNLGTIFLVGIGSIVVYLVRSSYNTANRTAVRNAIEDTSVLDPYEIDDLRYANEEFSPALFRKIVQALLEEHRKGLVSNYRDFVVTTRKVMCQHFHGDPSFTLQLGHLMDRVYVGSVLHYHEEKQKSKDGEKSDIAEAVRDEEDEAPFGNQASCELLQYLVILSLGVNSSVRDRVRLLFETILQCTPSEERESMSHEELVQLVGWLQRSCQLPADTQIALTDTKIPTQTYRRALPAELVSTARQELYGKQDDPSTVFGKEDEYRYDLDEFHRMLRTTSICAWGECYVKKKSLE